ncbi:MAG TPA: ABC transporter permease [Longimicrobiales bacterium]|nr:ABC transporter permease [Longimicrobiales bacterium]
MGQFLSDLRMAARNLAKRPGFSAIVVLTLALGIGANVAILAVVNAVLIRPLPYPESERIVWIKHHAPGLNLPELENSQGTLRLYKEHARSFSHFGAVREERRNLTGGVQPTRVRVAYVTPSMFGVLGVQPALGRALTDEDAEPGAPPVIVLTHAGWSAHFGRAPDVLGRTIELDGVRAEVVGVMPEGFVYPRPETVGLLPYRIEPDGPFHAFGIVGMARLAPGVTLEAARTEVSQLQPRLSEMFSIPTPEFLARAQWTASVTPFRDVVVGDAAAGLWIVLATVGFLLLVACASVANLFLVRAESRQRETGIKVALGASTGRIASSFLAESLLLGVAGGGVGVVLAAFALRALVSSGPAQLPRLHEIDMDGTVIGFAAVLSLAAGLLFGLLPLGAQLRGSLSALTREGRGLSAGRDRQRVRKALIVLQIALALVLLTGSGLMLRTFDRLRSVDPGIRPEGVLTLGVSFGQHRERAEAASLMQLILDEAAQLPGVAAIGATNTIPVNPEATNGGSFNIESRPRADGELPPVTMLAVVAGDYFQAMGMRLIEGRTVERGDAEHGRHVLWVNETFARTFLDGKALGERIQFSTDSVWYEIVGVVNDVRTFGLREEIRPMAYLPTSTQLYNASLEVMHLVVRTPGDPLALAPALRRVVERIEPNTPILTGRTMSAIVSESMADTSFTMVILLIAASVALLLGAIGLYGVIGYVVSQRTHEMGLRMALGAMPGQLRGMILRQGLALAGAGVAIGLVAAVLLSRLMESLLFGVSSRDPLTFVAVPIILLIVATVAAYIPARRASGVDPAVALRES